MSYVQKVENKYRLYPMVYDFVNIGFSRYREFPVGNIHSFKSVPWTLGERERERK